MNPDSLFLPIIIPFLFAVILFIIPARFGKAQGVFCLFATAVNLLLAIALFGKNLNLILPWSGAGLEFALRLYNFSAFIILATACFGFLVTLYSRVSLQAKNYSRQFFAYLLITLSLVNGAVLADNLLLMLFFWEGTLVTLFAMIAIGNKAAFKTATKAFIIVGACDLCMMFGIALTGYLAGTLTISKINLPVTTLSSIAFIFLMIGAISKGGSMPFHSWIPDAAVDAPLPFMAFMPAAIEKLLGIYFLTRICLDLFKLAPNSGLSVLLMSIGAITIILAVMMALIQKDYKRLLSYHAISQVGYMILGIGTCVPVGIVGGLFHMVNNALYKSCLFLTGGSVEKQTGSTDLEKLGGLSRRMPVTFICFLVAAFSISGFPFTNGFFSKELVYDAALERGFIFYLAAIIGTFLTAASFLKLGHAAFLGRERQELKDVKEAPVSMLFPMITIAALCLVFGLYNILPLRYLIQPILGEARLEGKDFSGFHINIMLGSVTVIALLAAFVNHIYGAKAKGSGLKAVDHIHYAPVLSGIYSRAEKRFFDPYDIGLKFVNAVTIITFWSDRAIDWVYNIFSVNAAYNFSQRIRKLHTGNYSLYLAWSLIGVALVIAVLFHSVK